VKIIPFTGNSSCQTGTTAGLATPNKRKTDRDYISRLANNLLCK